MKLLRNEDFQELLVNYKRAKRSFMVGHEVKDHVVSDVFYGKYHKPEDYLDSFARFVKENADHISAIQILLERPKEWRTQVLNELRDKLLKNNFPESELQKAHKRVYKKSLADIISMVKHAAKETEPIFTAEERVNRSVETFMAGKSFTKEQEKWLGFIKQHLIKNLTIELVDFEDVPLFERYGGLGKAKKVFGGKEKTRTSP